MLFDADCEFINMIQFYDENKLQKEETEESKEQLNRSSKSISQNSQSNPVVEDDFLKEHLIPPEEMKNLTLHAMSENNKYFIFIKEESVIKTQTEYSSNTKSKRKDGSASPNRSILKKGSPSRLRDDLTTSMIDQ